MQSVVDVFMREASINKMRSDLEHRINTIRPAHQSISIIIDDGLMGHIHAYITRKTMRAYTPESVDISKTQTECVQFLLNRIAPGMRQQRAFRDTVSNHLKKGIGYGNVRQHSSVHMRLPESVERPSHTIVSSYALSKPVIREDHTSPVYP